MREKSGLKMIANIQALRIFAAANVILFHIIGTSKSYSQSVELLNFLEGWGENGVDIFFVVSGFVMSHSQAMHKRTPVEFFRSRLLRIVPIYWVFTAFIIMLYLIFPSMFREMQVTPIWSISSMLFMSAVVVGQHPIVHVGWTLEWEMFFYLMFAGSLILKAKNSQFLIVTAILGGYIHNYRGLHCFGVFVWYVGFSDIS